MVAVLRRLLPYTTVALILTSLYSGWVLFSRAREARVIEEQRKARQAALDRKVVDLYGGDKLTILSFSATEGVVSPGQRVGLCYGVANAATVKIEPSVEPLRPALTHCTEAFPRKTTTFTLTATDKDGQSAAASLTVRVQ